MASAERPESTFCCPPTLATVGSHDAHQRRAPRAAQLVPYTPARAGKKVLIRSTPLVFSARAIRRGETLVPAGRGIRTADWNAWRWTRRARHVLLRMQPAQRFRTHLKLTPRTIVLRCIITVLVLWAPCILRVRWCSDARTAQLSSLIRTFSSRPSHRPTTQRARQFLIPPDEEPLSIVSQNAGMGSSTSTNKLNSVLRLLHGLVSKTRITRRTRPMELKGAEESSGCVT